MNRKPKVRDDWENFRRMAIPQDAPADQLREMRRAFYAGAHALLCNLLVNLDAHAGTPLDLDYIAALHQELTGFAQSVKEERA